MRTRSGCTITTMLLLMASTCLSQQQDRPILRIASPPDGTVVHPGETIALVVDSPAGLPAKTVFISAGGGIKGGSADSLPARLSVTIPAKIETGRYTVVAVAWTPRRMQFLASIDLDVEMPDSSADATDEETGIPVEKITTDPSTLHFDGQGQLEWVKVTATDASGRQVDVTDSTKLTLTSSDENVVVMHSEKMSGYRWLRAVNRGEASITATYAEGSRTVHTSIPVTVSNFYLSAAPISLSFGAVRVGSSVQRQVTVTYITEDPTVKIVAINVSGYHSVGDYSQTSDCISSSPVRTHSTCTITVTLTPRWPGNMAGDLCILPNWSVYHTCVPLEGRAIAP